MDLSYLFFFMMAPMEQLAYFNLKVKIVFKWLNHTRSLLYKHLNYTHQSYIEKATTLMHYRYGQHDQSFYYACLDTQVVISTFLHVYKYNYLFLIYLVPYFFVQIVIILYIERRFRKICGIRKKWGRIT